MALDLYQPCPCHQQRKLKFCCGKDVVAQIGKAVELLEGEQRLKAMDVLDRSLKQFGYKDCLATMRFGSALEMGNTEIAQRVSEGYVQENGSTSVGFAMSAILCLEAEDIDGAVDCVQSAMETGEKPSTLLEDAILTLAVQLFLKSQFVAARDHAGLFQWITGDPRGTAQSMINRFMQTPSLPLSIKHDWPILPAVDGHQWSKAAAQAIHWAGQGMWRKSLNALRPLAEANPKQAILWKNRAILAGRLNYSEEASKAWRTFAQCDNVEPDHAVEAELLSFLMDSFGGAETYSETVLTCDVEDAAALIQEMASDDFLLHMPGAENEKFRADDTENVPPKSIYALLDKPELTEVSETTDFKSLPNVIAVVRVFGRRTDKEAYIEILGMKNADLDQNVQRLLDQYSLLKKDTCNEAIVGETPCIFEDFDWKWRTPNGIDDDQIVTWCEQKWHQLMTEVLPGYRTQLLNGKSFAEATADPQLRRRVEAIVIHLGTLHTEMFDRAQGNAAALQVLGLPAPERIDPKTIRLEKMSLHQFARIDFSKMPTDMLAWAMEASSAVLNVEALKAIFAEVKTRLESDREELMATFPLATIHLLLAKLEPRTSKAAQFLVDGEQFLMDDDETNGLWLLRAFETSLSRRLGQQAIDLFRKASEVCSRTEALHIEFAKLCAKLGIRPNQGMPGMPPVPGMPGGSQGNLQHNAGPVSSLAGIQANAAGAPSKLWLPGME